MGWQALKAGFRFEHDLPVGSGLSGKLALASAQLQPKQRGNPGVTSSKILQLATNEHETVPIT